MNKYEKLIEYIINDNSDKARALFHDIIIEKSRDIYESLIDEEDLNEVGGNQVEDLVQDVQMDEEGISEEEDEEVVDADALDAEEEGDDQFDHHADVGGEEELEDRVMDLEDALDELKAEFDALMAGEEAEEEQFPGIHGDDEGEEVMPEEMYEAEEDEEEELDESAHEEDEEDEEMDESIVREYVEKVAHPSNKTEGGEVGKGGSANVNKQSTVAGKNDMGGSAANIVKGGAEQNPDGTSPKGKVGGLTKKGSDLPGAGSFENVPGAKAGNAFAKKESAVKKEEGAVAKHSPVAK